MRPAVLCEFNDVLLRDAGTSSPELLRKFAELGYRPSEESAALVATLEGGLADLLLKFG
jgi:hypothetical protein